MYEVDSAVIVIKVLNLKVYVYVSYAVGDFAQHPQAVPDPGKPWHCPGKILVNCAYYLPVYCLAGRWAESSDNKDNR